jgi:hypothetical protein
VNGKVKDIREEKDGERKRENTGRRVYKKEGREERIADRTKERVVN